jgi:O-succinylbenzoic acid--CoA ligase
MVRDKGQSANKDWLAAQAAAAPRKLALTFGGAHWSFYQLHEQVEALCKRLASLHLPAGAIVAVHMPNSAEYVLLIHALARLGLVLAPLNTRLAAPELEAQLRHLAPACLIHQNPHDPTALTAVLPGYAVAVISFVQLMGLAPAPFTPTPFDLERTQAIVFTSGSTDTPKAVELTFANHFWSATASAARIGVHGADLWLSCLPFYHVGGLAVVFRSCLCAIGIALHERFVLDAVNAALDAEPITLVSLVPTMLKHLLEVRPRFPTQLRLVLLGGAPASDALLRAALDRGVPIAPTYGLTEAASQVATMLPSDVAQKLGSVGKPLLFTEVRIANESGVSLPAGEIGEVVVRGPTVMRGYYKNAAATQRALRHGELFTGDLGYVDVEGDLWLVQRRSDLIVSGGENILPSEVERVLRLHPAVSEALVVGLPDAEWGQRVGAVVVPHHGQTIDVTELDTHTRKHLAGYKVPRHLRVVAALPQLSNGKVDAKAARKLFAQ